MLLFISQRHTLTVRAGTQGPGPVYDLPAVMGGTQPNGAIIDNPSWSFGVRAYPPIEAGRDGPGTGLYEVPRAIGRTPDGRYASQPTWTLAGRARPPVEAGGHSPGPIYNLPNGAMEKQVSGHKKSMPRASFTTFSRWAGVEKEERQNSVPGPGYYA